MGLLMSILVVCVGVLEAISCFRHIQNGYLPFWMPDRMRRPTIAERRRRRKPSAADSSSSDSEEISRILLQHGDGVPNAILRDASGYGLTPILTEHRRHTPIPFDDDDDAALEQPTKYVNNIDESFADIRSNHNNNNDNQVTEHFRPISPSDLEEARDNSYVSSSGKFLEIPETPDDDRRGCSEETFSELETENNCPSRISSDLELLNADSTNLESFTNSPDFLSALPEPDINENTLTHVLTEEISSNSISSSLASFPNQSDLDIENNNSPNYVDLPVLSSQSNQLPVQPDQSETPTEQLCQQSHHVPLHHDQPQSLSEQLPTSRPSTPIMKPHQPHHLPAHLDQSEALTEQLLPTSRPGTPIMKSKADISWPVFRPDTPVIKRPPGRGLSRDDSIDEILDDAGSPITTLDTLLEPITDLCSFDGIMANEPNCELSSDLDLPITTDSASKDESRNELDNSDVLSPSLEPPHVSGDTLEQSLIGDERSVIDPGKVMHEPIVVEGDLEIKIVEDHFSPAFVDHVESDNSNSEAQDILLAVECDVRNDTILDQGTDLAAKPSEVASLTEEKHVAANHDPDRLVSLSDILFSATDTTKVEVLSDQTFSKEDVASIISEIIQDLSDKNEATMDVSASTEVPITSAHIESVVETSGSTEATIDFAPTTETIIDSSTSTETKTGDSAPTEVQIDTITPTETATVVPAPAEPILDTSFSNEASTDTSTHITTITPPSIDTFTFPALIDPIVTPPCLDTITTPASIDPIVTPPSIDTITTPASIEPIVIPPAIDPIVISASIDPIIKPPSIEPIAVSGSIDPIITPPGIDPLVISASIDPIIKPPSIESIAVSASIDPIITPPAIDPIVISASIDPIIKPPFIEPIAVSASIDPIITPPAIDPIVISASIDPLIKPPSSEPVAVSTSIDPIITLPAIDPIVISAFIDPIIKPPSIEPIAVSASIDPIITPPAIDPIVISASIDPIVISASIDPIITPPAIEHIVTSASVDPIIASSIIDVITSSNIDAISSPNSIDVTTDTSAPAKDTTRDDYTIPDDVFTTVATADMDNALAVDSSTNDSTETDSIAAWVDATTKDSTDVNPIFCFADVCDKDKKEAKEDREEEDLGSEDSLSLGKDITSKESSIKRRKSYKDRKRNTTPKTSTEDITIKEVKEDDTEIFLNGTGKMSVEGLSECSKEVSEVVIVKNVSDSESILALADKDVRGNDGTADVLTLEDTEHNGQSKEVSKVQTADSVSSQEQVKDVDPSVTFEQEVEKTETRPLPESQQNAKELAQTPSEDILAHSDQDSKDLAATRSEDTPVQSDDQDAKDFAEPPHQDAPVHRRESATEALLNKALLPVEVLHSNETSRESGVFATTTHQERKKLKQPARADSFEEAKQPDVAAIRRASLTRKTKSKTVQSDGKNDAKSTPKKTESATNLNEANNVKSDIGDNAKSVQLGSKSDAKPVPRVIPKVADSATNLNEANSVKADDTTPPAVGGEDKDEDDDAGEGEGCSESSSKVQRPSSSQPAFWLIFSGEYTKAMSKDWHSGHFCCWQCDESLTGQRYVLRDDHPYCIKCYESVFANMCEECNKTIGIDSKDLSYKDKHWHEACFLCNKCRVSLVDKQFGSKADKIYCGNCYDSQFASRCDGCGEIFRAGTKKMEYKTRQWHEKCFCCCVCKSAIGTKSFIPREQEIYCATCYEEKFATRCVKCNKIITSGGVTYKNEPWHRECFTCTNCNTSLAGQRFTSRDEKPYCAECFGELFAKRCTACVKPITGIGGTRFISFEDRHWHNDCFICASCKTSLVGRGFITDAEDIICPECAKQKLM